MNPTTLCVLALCASCAACSSTDDPGDDWVGETYLLRIAAGQWTDPPGVGPEIGPYVPGFLIRVDGTSGRELDAALGAADDAQAQEMCNPTLAVAGTSEAYPSSQIDADEFPVYLINDVIDVRVNATIYEMSLTNVLPNGEEPAEEGKLVATMDFREVYPMFHLLTTRTPDRACRLMETELETTCQPCPADNEPYCLTMTAEGIGAEPFPSGLEDVPMERGSECDDRFEE